MSTMPPTPDNGCLICGRTSDAVPTGVVAEYVGDDARDGERLLLCEECAGVRDYARAFMAQARDHYRGPRGFLGVRRGLAYRMVSEELRAEQNEMGVHQFDEWTMDI
jgi:hypothetical protein